MKKSVALVFSLSLLVPLFSSCAREDNNVYHTVVWLNYDNSILEKDSKVKDGDMPTYHGQTPVKIGDDKVEYEFIGWTPGVVPSYVDATYVAKFKEVAKEYTITWKNYNDEVLEVEKYHYDDTPIYKGDIPTKDSDNNYAYKFSGWTPEIKSVTGDASYKATYKQIERTIVFKDRDNKLTDIYLKDQFDELKNTNDFGYSLLQKMSDVLLDYCYNNTDSKFWSSDYRPESNIEMLKDKVSNDMSNLREQASAYAIFYSISYQKAWEKVLAENDAVDEIDLYNKLLRKYEKDQLIDQYVKLNYDKLLSNYLSNGVPYLTKQILIRIENESIIKPTITSGHAEKLYQVVDSLSRGYSFSEVAKLYSYDSSGYFNGGDVSIMDSSTSFINEYKLGIYAYELLYTSKNSDKLNDIKDQLGISSNVASKMNEFGLSFVPFGIFYKLDVNANKTKDKDGNLVNDGDESYYPRNIYFNKYLNSHNIFLISNDAVADSSDSDLSVYLDKNGKDYSNTYYQYYSVAEEGKCGFRHVDGVSRCDEHLILTDEKGNPIIGVKSNYGVHFISITKSIFDEGLNSYYSLTNETRDSFIGRFGTLESISNERNTLINDVKAYSQDLERGLLKELLKINDDVNFICKDQSFDIISSIDSYYDGLNELSSSQRKDSLLDSWNTYIELLETINASSDDLVSEEEVFQFIN